MIPPSPVRTRFAPSPTGFLHIGGARTALYAWLYARKYHGQFILRIEDTDRERSTTTAIEAILAGIDWLGLHYDEGPVYQTKRLAHYQAAISQLLAENKAYYCHCSLERTETLRQQQMANKQKPRYDGHCRDQQFPPSDQSVVRFKNPPTGLVTFHDLVRGALTFSNTELDDLVIARRDGMPTYNFSVVVDDWEMGITHVIRGDDHLNNTPRQINILRALNAPLPYYAHVPMILGPDGKRLSKRHGAVSVLQYREDGFLPEALLNYLVRLGWSHGDQELFSIDELTKYFEIKDIHCAAAAVNLNKLKWLNQHYLKTNDPAEIAKILTEHMQQANIDLSQGPPLVDIVKAQRERVKTLKEMAENSRYFYQEITYPLSTLTSYFPPTLLPAMTTLYLALSQLIHWEAVAIHDTIQEQAIHHALPFGKLAQPLRISVTGSSISPPIDVTLVLLGQGRTLARLSAAIAQIQGNTLVNE